MTTGRDPHQPPAFPSVGGDGDEQRAERRLEDTTEAIGAAFGGQTAPHRMSYDDPWPPAEPVSKSGRSTRWRWITAAVATLVVVALVGGLVLFVGPRAGTPSAVAFYAPADVAVYGEVRLDMPGDQRARLTEFLSRFPGFADPAAFQQKLDQTLQEAFSRSGTGFDWNNDVNPWFGGQVSLFTSSIAPAVGTPPSMTFVFSVKDRARLDQVLAARLPAGEMQQEDYKGQAVWSGNPTDQSRRVSLAATDEALIVGTRIDDVKNALDVKSGEKSGLAGDAFFTQQLGALHADRLALVYYDAGRLLESMPLDTAGLPPGCLEDARSAADVRMIGEVRAEADHLALTMRSEIPTGSNLPPAPPNRNSGLIQQMPAGALAYVEMRQVGAVIKSGVQQLLGCVEAVVGVAFDPRQIEQFLGVSLEDYFDFISDAGIAFTFADGKVGGGLIATVDDTAVATSRVDRLLGALGLAAMGGGVTVEEERHGDVTINVIRVGGGLLPADEIPSIAVAVTNGRLYIGVGDFVTAALDRGTADSLAASPRLQAALSATSGDNAGIIYVDIAGLRTAAESLLPAEGRQEYDTEVKPFVQPLTHLILVNRTDGAIHVGNGFLYVE